MATGRVSGTKEKGRERGGFGLGKRLPGGVSRQESPSLGPEGRWGAVVLGSPPSAADARSQGDSRGEGPISFGGCTDFLRSP